MTGTVTKEEIKKDVERILKRSYGVTLDSASMDEMYKAVGASVREHILDVWADANKQVQTQNAKRLYYLSAEFLMGRALVNNMINLSLLDDYREALAELGFSLSDIEEREPDAGLGNGGLGRLAACFLDSLSTLDLPVTGCCIRYEHGLFRQKIVGGEQVEEDDNWLGDGTVWEVPRPEERVEVRFGGWIDEMWSENGLAVEHHGYTSVTAWPYDYPVMGYGSRMPATLRLWSARARKEIDMQHFNRGDYVRAMEESALVESISQILYPEDNHEQGRQLRLKQFYFLSSASMQFLVHRHKAHYGDLHTLPDHYCVQINDTHPTVAIPELIRILIDEEGMQWDEAMDIAARMFNYTNHTIMGEALERWNENMFRTLLPRIHRIVETMDQKFRDRIWEKWPGDVGKLAELAIIGDGEIRMANLCIAVCGHVNGVSQLHGEIIRTRTFRDFYILFPDKFSGITNGVTTRRWLAKANEPLTRLLAERLDGYGFLRDWQEFARVGGLLDDTSFLDDFAEVKRVCKQRLRDHLHRTQGIELVTDTMFDTQAKRLHEYKRQLLKILHILHLYLTKKQAPDTPLLPATWLFAAKAAPGYYRAKEIIRLIGAVGDLVNGDPAMKGLMQVVFIENFSVSEAELLIPASEVSEQLSTAGLEASGTGNMKFMLNGAVTIGTMDGANVEIAEAVGSDAVFIFGALVDEISRLERFGYDPRILYESDPRLRRVLDALVDGTLPVPADRQFGDLHASLLHTGRDQADRYFVLHDFASYAEVYDRMTRVYRDPRGWARIAAKNTACSGIFSSDRTIEKYNEQIWHMRPIREAR
ncbi:MAG: glycogen/starch/alpha-glucan phosphorylase [Clostridiales Family XIII bacterium]|jgi:starch phosphorylase|nr:glycogen/starch/alpha-glucan phosphorylase [Clostridiales Family XIII bacterium]